MEKLLTVEEAKARLFAGLEEITGWKLLKSRSELKKKVGDVVFQLNVFFNHYNRSYEYIGTEMDFRMWCRSYGKVDDVNTDVGFFSYRGDGNYYFDITTEEKLEAVLAELKVRLEETAVSLCERFEADHDAAVKRLAGEDLLKYRVWLRFIEDKLGREEAEKAAKTVYENAPEPVKKQLAEFAATGKSGPWLRMDRNAKYMAEHGLIPTL